MGAPNRSRSGWSSVLGDPWKQYRCRCRSSRSPSGDVSALGAQAENSAANDTAHPDLELAIVREYTCAARARGLDLRGCPEIGRVLAASGLELRDSPDGGGT
jgi:hypothetical protein